MFLISVPFLKSPFSCFDCRSLYFFPQKLQATFLYIKCVEHKKWNIIQHSHGCEIECLELLKLVVMGA
jgi:hypothetical protein